MHGAHLGEVPLDGAGLAALDLQKVVHVGRLIAIDVDLVHQHALEALHSITVFLKFCCETRVVTLIFPGVEALRHTRL